MNRVITPLDGSALAERALPLAACLARQTNASLLLVEAAMSPLSMEVGPAVSMVQEAAADYLRGQATQLMDRYRVHVETMTGIADPARLILGAATEWASAIVMATHGRTGLSRLLMGSVAEHVLRQAPVPVYLVPESAGRIPDYPDVRHILVPLDGSPLAESVLKPVTDLALATGAEVTLLTVFEDGTPHGGSGSAADQRRRMEAEARATFSLIEAHLLVKGVIVSGRWATGQPAAEILTMAHALKPSLIALATHGRSGLDRLRFGSVAESVLRAAGIPVMTVGPNALSRLTAGSTWSPMTQAAVAAR